MTDTDCPSCIQLRIQLSQAREEAQHARRSLDEKLARTLRDLKAVREAHQALSEEKARSVWWTA